MRRANDRSLHGRLAELNAEIRGYPTPIARCDQQLSALLEERAAIHARLEALERPAGGCSPINVWTNDGGMNGA